MKSLSVILLCLILHLSTLAQRQGVGGTVSDSLGNSVVTGALVYVIKPDDSLIVSYGYSNAVGRYAFVDIVPGIYKLIISCQGFADYVDEIEVQENKFLDLGSQFLTSRYKVMEDIVVRYRGAPMQMRNDTLEFLADSFYVRPNASIEDLLKVLPGVSVSRNGKISVYGKRVDRLFVDGEEFFGDDPTIATRNLPARIVDKVQVFENKSELTKATGFDDGKASQVINIKLKENSKKGYFGKLVVGGNFNNNWNSSILVNSFKDKRQLSVFGSFSNIGGNLLERRDQSKFGFKINDFANSLSEHTESHYDVGPPKNTGLGLHYANKWNDNKEGINTNFVFSKLGNRGSQIVSDQLFMNDYITYMYDSCGVNNMRSEYSWDGKYEVQFDSTSSVRISLNAIKGELSVNNDAVYSTRDDVHMINRGIRSNSFTGSYDNYRGDISWRKVLSKKGRGLDVSARWGYMGGRIAGLLKSQTEYQYPQGGGSISSFDTLNLRRTISGKEYDVASKAVYRHPVFKKGYVDINYGFSIQRKYSDQSSFEDDARPNAIAIDSLSNDYNYSIISNIGGASLVFPAGKYLFTVGQDLSLNKYLQNNIEEGVNNSFLFFNVLPTASISYSFAKFTNLSFRYSTASNSPSLRQIQPVSDNTNPMIVHRGNPDLRQTFSTVYSIMFNSLDLISQKKLYSLFSFTKISDFIGYNDYLDNSGRRIIQPINTDGAFNIFSYINYSLQLKSIKANWINDVTVVYNRRNGFINDIRNRTDNSVYTYSTSISRNGKEIFLEVGSNVSYNILKNSVVGSRSINFWDGSCYANVNIQLPGKLELGSDGRLLIQHRLSHSDAQNRIFLWSSFFSKRILKRENAILKLSVHNILDQNTGYSRFVSRSGISEIEKETLGRYWMLSFILNFDNQIKE